MAVFVKIEHGIVDRGRFDQYVPAHVHYVNELNEHGHNARTGYWAEYGGGMLIFEADDLAEAQKIVLNDPLVKFECVHYELHEWKIVVEP